MYVYQTWKDAPKLKLWILCDETIVSLKIMTDSLLQLRPRLYLLIFIFVKKNNGCEKICRSMGQFLEYP